MSYEARRSVFGASANVRRLGACALVLTASCGAAGTWLAMPVQARKGGKPKPSCLVPHLEGQSLGSAKRALDEAHCTLGNVTKPNKHHGTPVVTKQTARPGETLTSKASVSVTLAAPQCVVPHLKGDSLLVAKHALSNAHCELGNVTEPYNHHGLLAVTKQGKKPGHKLANETKVSITLATK